MCYPRSDHLIVRLIEEGRIRVDGEGRGRVFLRGPKSDWHEVGLEINAQQAGKRPAGPLYRRFSVKIDGHARTLRVSRVIYVAIYGPTPYEIDHVDDDSLNCGAANLQGLTRIENEQKKRESVWWRDLVEAATRGEMTPCSPPF